MLPHRAELWYYVIIQLLCLYHNLNYMPSSMTQSTFLYLFTQIKLHLKVTAKICLSVSVILRNDSKYYAHLWHYYQRWNVKSYLIFNSTNVMHGFLVYFIVYTMWKFCLEQWIYSVSLDWLHYTCNRSKIFASRLDVLGSWPTWFEK